MGYLTLVAYNILINGAASGFFYVERGLWQGFPASPLLFLLIMEGFSRLIEKEKRKAPRLVSRFLICHL